jgi:hypothetical protein
MGRLGHQVCLDRMSARRVAALVAVALVTVPTAVAAVRADEYTSSFEVEVLQNQRFALPGGPVGYLRELLRDPALGRATVALSGQSIDDASLQQRIEVRSVAPGTAVLSATARTPDRAEHLALGLRAALMRTGRAAFRAEAAARRRFLRSRLKSRLTTPHERRNLAEAVRAAPAFFGTRKTRLDFRASPERPRATRPLDRVADALPGRYPPAPRPLAAAAAGALAALGLAAAALAVGLIAPSRPRSLVPDEARRPRRPRTARRRSPP